MRHVRVTASDEVRDGVVKALEEAEVEYAVTGETSDREVSHVFTFPVRTDEVEEILDSLKEVGVGEKGKGNVVVSEVEAVVSEEFEEEEEEDENGDERIARDELKATAKGLSRSTLNYVVFTVVSAVVATAGVLQNSAAVVVGSMVIAPLIGPAMASSVGSVLKDDDLFWNGVKAQFVGVGVAVGSAILFALLARLLLAPEIDLLLIEQVTERVNPGLLALAIALGAGVAGALSITSGASAALVGVMIAAALIPPAAVVGLGVAYERFAVAASSGVLVLVNLLSINLAALVVLWAKGYRPEKWYDEKPARRVTQKRVVTLFAVVVVLSAFLVVSTVNERSRAGFEEEVENYVEGVDPNADIEFSYTTGFFSSSPERVTVYADGVTSDGVAERVSSVTDASVEVVVVQRETESAQTETAR
ncbi:MAG: TIGR00341 family protein [Halobacteria archaeon]